MKSSLLCLACLVTVGFCRDFYVGMFKKNDYLVAQDRLYKEKVPHSRAIAMYGRKFKCPITYFRVVDRLGLCHASPTVSITRGGLQKPFIILKIHSVYNYPLSVNIYIGCENKHTTTARSKVEPTTAAGDEAGSNETQPDGDQTTADDGGAETGATEGAEAAPTEAPAEE